MTITPLEARAFSLRDYGALPFVTVSALFCSWLRTGPDMSPTHLLQGAPVRFLRPVGAI